MCAFFAEKSDFDPTRKYLILSIANLRKVAFLQTQRLNSAGALAIRWVDLLAQNL